MVCILCVIKVNILHLKVFSWGE